LGQLAIKSGAGRTGSFLQQCLDPFTILGLVAYALAAVGYMVAIRRIPVSVAFPSVSASYIVVAIVAHFLWNEPFGIRQLLAIVLIVSGVYLLNVP
jgi:drug/metabolite transporter (DMT)-like permease